MGTGTRTGLAVALALTLSGCGLDAGGRLAAAGAPGDGGDAGGDDASTAGIDAPLDTAGTACPCPAQSVCVASACAPARRVFISANPVDGTLGGNGLVSADAACNTDARGAQIGGYWKAWTSTAADPVAIRFTPASVGYYLVDGTKIADDWTSLFSGTIQHEIDEAANGQNVGGVLAWTGTLPSGSAANENCNDWSTNLEVFSGVYGDSTRTTSGAWTDAGTLACDSLKYLYCVEQ